MFCVPIIGPTLSEARRQIGSAVAARADLIELRVDLLSSYTLSQLRALKAEFAIPWLVTVRTVGQGGAFAGGKEAQVGLLEQLCTLSPELLDIEADSSAEQARRLRAKLGPSAKLVLSAHYFNGLPAPLDQLMVRMEQFPADFYKLAVSVTSSLEALALSVAVRKANQRGGRWIGIAMGPDGVLTRVIGPIIRSPLAFAPVEIAQASAPGQLTLGELSDLYRARSVNPSTALLGLIGDPVDKSRSHLMHNRAYSALGLDAVYAKMRVPLPELRSWVAAARELSVRGLSVTMPLKEAIVPLLDALDPSAEHIGAVNTIVLESNRLIGYNTDGRGALDAIEHALGSGVLGRRLIIVGAGGTARAIAWEGKMRGAEVTIFNRTEERARQVAKALGCRAKDWSQLADASRSCDILVQATSVGMAPDVDGCPIDPTSLRPGCLVFDVVTKPAETRLLKEAAARGCITVGGLEMLVRQAIMQVVHWFGDAIDTQKAEAAMREVVSDRLSS